MVHESSVGEAKSLDGSMFLDNVHDAASVHGPKAQVPDDHGDSRARFNRRIAPTETHPTQVKHLPLSYRCPGGGKALRACAKLHSIVVDGVTGGRGTACQF